MKKCSILDDYQNVALRMADWSSISKHAAITSFQQHFTTENEMIDALSDSEIIVVMRERTPLTSSILRQLPKLKLIVTSGMRNASIDLDAAKKHGITVSGTTNFSEPPVELTWGLIHTLARNIILESNAIKAGRWQTTIGTDLKDKQLGLLGFGKTGILVARVGKALGMNVCAWSQNLTEEATRIEGVKLASSKHDLIKHSDFISIHLVLSPRTKNLIGPEEFKLMRKSAFLVNTSRAGIVDQQALIHALRTGEIAAAAADVFETEPLPENDPFRTLPNFIATPHLGYVTEKNYRAYFTEAVEDIQAYLNGAPIRQLVSTKDALGLSPK